MCFDLKLFAVLFLESMDTERASYSPGSGVTLKWFV